MPHNSSQVGNSAPSRILTPDRRVRVFISSTLVELAAERLSARHAVTQLHLTPVMFEAGARSHPPRDLYRSYLAQSDVFVGIYGQSYGWVAPAETVSGLEDEYLAAGHRPKLIYVKEPAAEREPRLRDMLNRLRDDDQASYKHFDTPEALAELLADDLAVLLTERFTDTGVGTVGGSQLGNLPIPPTEIIGRESEVADVAALLADESVHLVTLLGPGGIGKTRLAVEVARQLHGTAAFDTVWFVDLAPLRDADDWEQAVALGLGVRPPGNGTFLDVIIDRLQDRRTLLVLDNFEHVLAAASRLSALLSACQGLTVLVTSRIVLRVRGEREFTLAPLGTPPLTTELDAVKGAPAVQLLIARARDVRPGFTVTAANADAVAELTRRLDGIPLALELVAAQFRLLTPTALLERLTAQLSQPLDLASGQVDLPGRQRTLRTTIDWSHSLLSEAEKTLLARVSVLSPPWSLTTAEAVGADDGDLDVLTTLTSLVAQSLIRADAGELDPPRFRLLETIRSYASERLADRGDVDATMSRLTGHLLTFVATVGPALESTGNEQVSHQIDQQLGDLRVSTNWALARDDADTVVRLGAPLFSYWWSHGLLSYTAPLAERTATLPSAAHMSADAHTLLLWARGMARVAIGQTSEAEPLLQEMVTATQATDARLNAHAKFGLGLALIHRSGPRAAAVLTEAADAFRALQLDWGLSITLSAAGGLALEAGNPDVAESMHLEALAAAERIDNDHLRAQLLDMLGLDAAAVGETGLARERYAAGAALHTQLLDLEGSAYGLSGLAGLAQDRDLHEVAAQLLSASTRSLDAVGVAVWPGMTARIDALTRSVHSDMTAPDLERATQEGRRLRIPDAFRYALSAIS